jgi:hypothetical protein
MFTDHILTVIDSTRQIDQLFQISTDLTRSWLNGQILEDDYGRLREAVEARQKELKASGGPAPLSPPRVTTRQRRRIPRSPDRIASRQRRAAICEERWLPPLLATQLALMPAMKSAASVIVKDLVLCGVCWRTNAAIAAMAGVCETTVKNTKQHLRLTGWILAQVSKPHLYQGRWVSKPTRIRVLNPDLEAWIKRRRRIIADKALATTKTDEGRKRDRRGLVDREPILKVEERGLPIRRVVPG